MLLRAVARGPGVWVEGGGGAGEGERLSVVVIAIVFGVLSDAGRKLGSDL